MPFLPFVRAKPEAAEWWEVWYRDTFDRDCPPSIDKKGVGLVAGIAELWARHLFEAVRSSGQSGFSSFHLRWQRGRMDISGPTEGATRLRSWLFGNKQYSEKGYVAEAESGLLFHLATVHARLIDNPRTSEDVLVLAQQSTDAADFSRRLTDLVGTEG